MVDKFFDKKSKGGSVNNEIKQNEQLAEELHKPIIKEKLKRRLYPSFKDNIWGADFADVQLISKFNKGIRFLLCAINVFSKMHGLFSLKDKNGITIANAFEKILDNLTRKPNKVWLNKGSKFHYSSFKKWWKDKDIDIYSTRNERKSVVAERFVRTLKDKIYKYMTPVSKNVYIL